MLISYHPFRPPSLNTKKPGILVPLSPAGWLAVVYFDHPPGAD